MRQGAIAVMGTSSSVKYVLLLKSGSGTRFVWVHSVEVSRRLLTLATWSDLVSGIECGCAGPLAYRKILLLQIVRNA